MSIFQRNLNLNAISNANLASAPWLTDMLRHWYPAGNCVPMVQWDGALGSKKEIGVRPMGLRLAIRNGYMNFYCGGQSIAKVTLGKTLKAKTHSKYLNDDVAGSGVYQDLEAHHADVAPWMSRSHAYHGVEKLFVDAVCSVSGTIIDMEMGLPGLPVKDAKTGEFRLVAPRIDLVALEPDDGGWKIVFWEAKLPRDARMRTQGDKPEVVAQLESYSAWFADEAANERVLAGYKNTCRMICEIHKRAENAGIPVRPLHAAIVAIGNKPELLKAIDPKVRLLIDLRKDDPLFCKEHLPKLEKHGIPLHCVRTEADLNLSIVAATA